MQGERPNPILTFGNRSYSVDHFKSLITCSGHMGLEGKSSVEDHYQDPVLGDHRDGVTLDPQSTRSLQASPEDYSRRLGCR